MKKRFFAAALSVIFLCSCSAVSEEIAVPAGGDAISGTETMTAATEETAVTTMAPAVTEPPVISKTVTFTALGDNLIHSSIYNQAARRAGGNGYDFEYAYAGVADLLDKSDITVLNQETLICNDIFEPSTYPCFNSPVALGDHMAELGVDVFTIANNHTLDKGVKGLSACLDYYDERGMVRVGAYRDEADRADIRVIEADGVRVSFLCYTESLNGLSLPADTKLQIGRFDKDTIIKEIAAAKEISDICIVSLHWGTENSSAVEDYQRVAAKEFAEAGADAIIGNHPHVLREVEMITAEDGRQALCAYSLGNFISAQSVGTNLIGGVLNFSVTVEEGKDNVIGDIEFIPVITHYDGNFSNIRLYKLSDYPPEMADAHGVRNMSKFSYDYIFEYLESKGLYEGK
ncbi:MAG: CapA family protein [Oscillospiraceae bacterium]|nr:CapA family protein [Oscillospiraceae bacterium]